MTSSNGSIFRVTALCAGSSPVAGEFPSQRPVTRSFDVFSDLRMNKRLNKRSRGHRAHREAIVPIITNIFCDNNISLLEPWKQPDYMFLIPRWFPRNDMPSADPCCLQISRVGSRIESINSTRSYSVRPALEFRSEFEIRSHFPTECSTLAMYLWSETSNWVLNILQPKFITYHKTSDTSAP